VDAKSAIAFEDWYRDAHARLVTLLTLAVGDRDTGREAADEALVRAYERWDRVSTMASPSAWTYRVGLNVARRKARRRALEARLFHRTRVPDVPGPTGELWLLVAVLPTRQREAVLLRHVAQFTELEIAAAMGIERGTVSSTLRTAYRQLERAISADAEPTAPREDQETRS
jgi:RNA polymerase sigma-70 factor (ECF subfamily)